MFNNIIGYDAIKMELEKICDMMLHLEKYMKLGVKTPQGILLYGPPGVGKTSMVNAFIE